MKATGIVRKVDDLGRIVIPIELRRTLGIETKGEENDGEPLEIYVDDDMIIFKKYEPACIFCGEAQNTTKFKGKVICSGCLESIKKEA
ncbi:AbrB/MazE/SpoVT family DNA-binding domain-containing protein [Sporohalobacter salinus]|uniref:AbrB/MazE/SpoVT family DNA-binding domain-containing protein n=1 Tax=Sporohalobacter salinus TaxID=1494606 RepID=UPI00195FCC86|nr:AbrB/MazE/SpoVT family DNA-binding domain-containing protein [Sporohalobacter salinus]MBM7623735.1 transcriptional pleiotropic regulator of transition state genes [Sporohalobacter salinus]